MFEATRSKDTFIKYVDAVLSKMAKMRSLVGDLQRNYPQDQTAKKFLNLNRSNMWIIIHLMVNQKKICHPKGDSPATALCSPRAVVTLNGDLVTLDGQYNTLSDIVAGQL